MKRLLCLFVALLSVTLATASRADEIVMVAQQKLKRAGYYQGAVDGDWGSQTAAAVRRYQLAKNLKVTGELNRQTLDHLGIRTEPPKPAHVALADLFVGGPYLQAGPEFQIQTVRQAKKNLKILGFYSGPVDGDPSPDLVFALKAYQQDARFKPTGRLDKVTLQALDLLRPSYAD